jgi:hypothetical protein
MRSKILSTLINPPLVCGVTAPFAFILILLLFIDWVLAKDIFGPLGFIICLAAITYFYRYGCKKTATDPYWLNIFVLSVWFSRNKLKYLTALITKKPTIIRK